MKQKIFFYLLILIILISNAYAATIHGSIYDLSLKKVKNAVVEINSSPKQRMVSVDGVYSFSIENGYYQITASFEGSEGLLAADENITISSEGDYVFDLFLFPDLTDELSLADEQDFLITEPFAQSSSIWVIILFAVALMFIFLIYMIIRLNKLATKEAFHEEKMLDDDLSKIISFLKENNGRLTQKEIRKQIPYSEAKISLMLAELESLGKVKKIKKGRGNIIVLNK